MASLDEDLRKKRENKYDVQLEVKVAEWLAAVSGCEKDDELSFAEWLKDGTVLCRAVNAIREGTIKKIHESKMPFKQMENISSFLKAARELFGVHGSDMFSTVDLFEEKNMGSVVQCIFSLGGQVQRQFPDYEGPKLGIVQKTGRGAGDERPNNMVKDLSMGFNQERAAQ